MNKKLPSSSESVSESSLSPRQIVTLPAGLFDAQIITDISAPPTVTSF